MDQDYWRHVGLAMKQMHGMRAGYSVEASIELSLPRLTMANFWWFAYDTESDDVQMAASRPSRVDIETMDHDVFSAYVINTTRCSALFRVTPELDDILSAHATWCGYSWMLRIHKVHNLRFSATSSQLVVMTSYPGFPISSDDFYITEQKLVIIETSNSIFNNSLYDLITPQTLPYWVRNMVANRLATCGQEWHELFYRFNSGTYNNQWSVVDYKKFTPRQPLKAWTFSVSEQLPGPYSHIEDQTFTLQRGHWPSYNIPFYEDVYNMSGYPRAVEKHGVSHGYQLAPRAAIFRRQGDSVNSLADLQRFIRFNGYGTGDPLAKSPEDAIASRSDLKPQGATASGAIDGKAVNAAFVDRFAFTAIAGPTTQGHPPFEYSGRWASTPHFGAPDRYDFGWQTLVADDLAPARVVEL